MPEGWEWTRLSNIASFSGGKTPSTSDKTYWGNDVLWVTSKDMKTKYIESSLMMLSDLGAKQLQIYPIGTLLMVVRSGILRHTLPLSILSYPATINQDLKAINFYYNGITEYIYFCLKAFEKNILQKYTKAGATVENIEFNSFKNIILPIAPEKQMESITSKTNDIEKVFCSINKSKNSLYHCINNAKSKILDLAIRGKLVPQDPNDEPASALLERIKSEKEKLIKQGKIKRNNKQSVIFKGDDNSYYQDLPENWQFTSLKEITTPLTLNDGDWILSQNMADIGEVKLLQLGSIGNMVYIDKGFKYLTRDTFNELSCTEIFPGYLLINRIISDKMCCCIVPNIDGTIITTVDTCWIAPSKTSYDIKFLMYQFASPTFQKKVLLKTSGTTRRRISKNNLINIALLLPPLAEQKRIVEAIEKIFAALDDITNQVT